MRNRMKRALTVVILIGLIANLAGCKQETNQGKDAATSESITLRFAWWGNDSRKESTLKVMELYRKQNPHVTFEAETYKNTGDLSAELAIQTANQDSVDLFQADYNFIFDYINRNLVEPLTPYAEQKVLDLSDIDPSLLAPGMKEDTLYALPMSNNTNAFVYDPELFAQAGVKVPDESYTVDELYQVLTQLKEAIHTPDFYPLGNKMDVFTYLRGYKKSMYNADNTGLGYEDDKLMADYFTLLKKWSDEGLLASSSNSSVGEDHPIVSGKAAFFSISSNSIVGLGKVRGQNLKLLPYPSFIEGETGNAIKPSMFLAVSSYSKNKEEAAKFVDFFIHNEEANDILNGERGVPISKKISDRLSAKLDETGKEQYRLMDYLKTHSKPIDPPYPSSNVIITNTFEMLTRHVLNGHKTPEEAAKEFREYAMEYLADNGGTP